MRRTSSPVPRPAPLSGPTPHRARTPHRGRPLRTLVGAAVVLVAAVAALTSPAVAAPAPPPAPVDRGTVVVAPGAEGAGADGGAAGTGGVRPLATVEDEEAWCSYLSSYYLAFPSPWSARLYNCQHRAMSVAPVYSNGSVGACVRVPARHSRHLGGNVTKWVTDIRVC
ncbi:hypothetical protein GC089_05880 [Cellulomonas sp. JZ18]|uniref:hypothetical protein n=1 Tax=Cellulomonas sp. JZ18 TaxID=2654191 RepID=UPI0012D3E8A0|nr:hypothetical protein [Cellulomonas sp. JZ18]QGQ18856.1 hypothetical protein GC089_05880 [Cellulomonas sp. JZ18]